MTQHKYHRNPQQETARLPPERQGAERSENGYQETLPGPPYPRHTTAVSRGTDRRRPGEGRGRAALPLETPRNPWQMLVINTALSTQLHRQDAAYHHGQGVRTRAVLLHFLQTTNLTPLSADSLPACRSLQRADVTVFLNRAPASRAEGRASRDRSVTSLGPLRRPAI